MSKIKGNSYYANQRPEMLAFIPDTADKILEIGCGEGHFSAQLADKGMEVWAIEPNERSAAIASESLHKVILGNLSDKLAELPDNYFDVVIFNDVLEHLIEPWEDLNKVKPKMNKNGVIVSSIPNVRYAKNVFNFLFRKDWKYTEHGILDSTHFRFFTKKSIRRMFEENGFAVEKMKGINVTGSFLYFPFAVLFNILFLFTQTDMFFMQYGTVAKKID